MTIARMLARASLFIWEPSPREPSHSRSDPLSRIQSLQSMKRLLLAVFLGTALVSVAPQPSAAASPRRVLAIHFTADVNPVTQDWVNHQLDRAQDGGYAAAVIVIDTPGGLEESMRKIVAQELSLHIPVLVYVSPNGARAGSGG